MKEVPLAGRRVAAPPAPVARLLPPSGGRIQPKSAATASAPGAILKPGSKPTHHKPKTRFEELLTVGFEGRNDPRAFEEDLRLQRMLQKKLGMKKVG